MDSFNDKNIIDNNKLKIILILEINLYKLINPIEKLINKNKVYFFNNFKNNWILSNHIHQIIYNKIDNFNDIINNINKKFKYIALIILKINTKKKNKINSLEDILIKKEIEKLRIYNFKLETKIKNQKSLIYGFNKKIQLFTRDLNKNN